MKSLSSLVLIALFVAPAAFAQNKRVDTKDIDSLGGNAGVVEMAKSLDPENRARIVQKRTVDRHSRLELGLGWGGVLSGDPYLRTQNITGSAEFHINPRWSIGARYIDHGNSLSPEGERVFSDARASYNAGGRTYVMPDIDPAKRSAFATLAWYPVYGKTNLLDTSIAQFDLYLMAGYGQTELSKNGWTPLATVGAGVGVWMSRNWAIRTELRGQNHKDNINGDARSLNSTIASVSLGYIL